MVSWFDIALGMGYGRATRSRISEYKCPYCEGPIKPDDRVCPNCNQELPRCPRCNNIIPSLDVEIYNCPRCVKEVFGDE